MLKSGGKNNGKFVPMSIDFKCHNTDNDITVPAIASNI